MSAMAIPPGMEMSPHATAITTPAQNLQTTPPVRPSFGRAQAEVLTTEPSLTPRPQLPATKHPSTPPQMVAHLFLVLMGVSVRLDQIKREGIRGLTGEVVRAARAAGKPYKLVCRAQRTAMGVAASVGPEQLALSDPLAWVAGTSSVVYFET